MDSSADAPSRARIAGAIAIVATGMVVFAFPAHQGMPWVLGSFAGLAIAAAAILWSGSWSAGPAEILGLDAFGSKAALWSLAGLALGAAAALSHRHDMGLPLLPSAQLRGFVIVACLIGATEELVFRGWMLGRARSFGWAAAIVVAAAGHAAYKTALFAWPPDPVQFDLMRMAIGTFVGGIVLGVLRKASGSLAPALAAHVAFDFIVYRTYTEMPWWVWG